MHRDFSNVGVSHARWPTSTQGLFLKRSLGSVGYLQVAFVLLKERSKERLRRWRVANIFHLHPVEANTDMAIWPNTFSLNSRIIRWTCISPLTLGTCCRTEMPRWWWQQPLSPQASPVWLMQIRLVLEVLWNSTQPVSHASGLTVNVPNTAG